MRGRRRIIFSGSNINVEESIRKGEKQGYVEEGDEKTRRRDLENISIMYATGTCTLHLSNFNAAYVAPENSRILLLNFLLFCARKKYSATKRELYQYDLSSPSDRSLTRDFL